MRLARYVPPANILRNRGRQRRDTRLVRGYCLFLCLDALRRSGLAGDLVRGGVRLQGRSDGRVLDAGALRSVAEYLSALKVVEISEANGGSIRLTRRGRRMLSSPPGFPELVSGYRAVLERLPGLLCGEPGAQAGARRDEGAVREASTSLGFDFAYPILSGLLKERGVSSVLELGSSRLALLKYLCDRNGVEGWGIDTDSGVVAEARASLLGSAYEGRLRVMEGDALAPETVSLPSAKVGAVVAVDFFHYYLNDRKRVVSALAGWREKLPSSLFIVVEVCRRPARETAGSPLPKPEYNLCHRLTGQALPEEDEWPEVFREAGYALSMKLVFPSLEHGAFVFRSRD